MAKKCSNGCNYPVFSKGKCKSCWQREYGKPLKNSTTPLKRTPLKKSRKPINKVSARRQKQLDKYNNEVRPAFLKEHTECELKVDSGCTIYSTELHHLGGKEGELLNDITNIKATCRHCHEIVTEHSKDAIKNGHSLSRHKTPEQWQY